MKPAARLFVLALMLSVAFAFLPVSAEEEKHVIVLIQKEARSNGKITFLFTPTGGESKKVVVEVAKKEKVKGIAQAVRGALANVVEDDQYVVKMKDERKVSVEGRHGNTFELTLGEVTVDGLSVTIKNP